MKSNKQIASEKHQKKIKDAGLKTPRTVIHEDELKLFRSLLALHVLPKLPLTLKVKKSLKQEDK